MSSKIDDGASDPFARTTLQIHSTRVKLPFDSFVFCTLEKAGYCCSAELSPD